MGCTCSSLYPAVNKDYQSKKPVAKDNVDAAKDNVDAAKDNVDAAKDNLSPIYDRLPPNAEKHRVRNVYDGDTLTLVNETRVRFLGIDTPEIREKQAFAQEAKAYTKDYCDKKEIWISFEEGHNREDHYGRLLAFVWVPTSKGRFLCVNEGLVMEGLAGVYFPGKSKKLNNKEKLIKMQKQARKNKLGLWKTFQDYNVVKTTNGSAFHVPSCKYLMKSRNLVKIMASDGLDIGLHPCRTCLGDA